MGSQGSKAMKRVFSPFSRYERRSEISPKKWTSSRAIVRFRRGSLYIDEDGDMAHEFYIEVFNGSKATMKRITDNLVKQGNVEHEFPRLDVDCPIVLLED